MFWGNPTPQFQSLIELTQASGTTLESVLADSSLSGALTYETAELIEFLLQSDNLTRLFEWSLSANLIDSPDFLTNSRLATKVICSDSTDLTSEITETQIFLSALQDFFDSPALTSPFLCANYQRIFDKYTKETNGRLVGAIPGLIPNLANNLHILAFRVLVLSLLTDFRGYLDSTDELISSLQFAISKSGKVAKGAIAALSHALQDDRQPIAYVNLSSIARSLFELIVLDTTTDIEKTEAFALIDLIMTKSTTPGMPELLAEFEPQMNFAAPGLAGRAVFRVYRKSLAPAADRFFANLADDFLGQILLTSLLAVPLDALCETLNRLNLVDRVIGSFSNEAKAAGILTELALLINTVPEIASTDRWTAFMAETLGAKIEWIRSASGESDLSPYRGSGRPSATSQTEEYQAPVPVNWDTSSDEDEEDDDDDDDDAGPPSADVAAAPALSAEEVLGQAFGQAGVPAGKGEGDEEEDTETEAQRQARELMQAMMFGGGDE
jgi:hypothetical protein